MKSLKLVLAAGGLIFGFLAHAQETREIAAAGKSLDELIGELYDKSASKFESTKGRVAVMDFPALDGKVDGLSAYISNKIGNKLIEGNRQVVDRSTLERIFAEQRMQQSALMDSSTAAKIGKMAGAALFTMGSYTVMPSKISLTLRVLSVETGQFVAAAEVSTPFNTDLKAEVDYLMKKPAPTPFVASGNGGSNDSGGGDVKQTATAFDNWLCAEIRSGISLSAIFKKALTFDEYDNDDVKGCEDSNYTDSAGENLRALRFDRWYLKYSGNCEDAAIAAIKGRAENVSRVTNWAYVGTAELKGEGDCLPHGSGMWTESRASRKKKKQ